MAERNIELDIQTIEGAGYNVFMDINTYETMQGFRQMINGKVYGTTTLLRSTPDAQLFHCVGGNRVEIEDVDWPQLGITINKIYAEPELFRVERHNIF